MPNPAFLPGSLVQAGDAALVVDEAGTILFASESLCRSLRYEPNELHGQSVELLIPERHRLAHIGHRLHFTDDRRTRTMAAGLKLFARCKDGSEHRVAVGLYPIQRGLHTLMVAVVQMLEAGS